MPWTHFRPTPEQIEEKCREIRAAWDETTHRRRWARPTDDFWFPPVVTLSTLAHDDRDSRSGSAPLSELSG